MLIRIGFWLCGIISGAIFGCLIGYLMAADMGGFWGMIGGGLAFVAARLWFVLPRQNSN